MRKKLQTLRLAALISACVFLGAVASAASIDCSASEEGWIRSIAPGTTYNLDFLDVRRTVDTSLSGMIELRYGLVQHALTELDVLPACWQNAF